MERKSDHGLPTMSFNFSVKTLDEIIFWDYARHILTELNFGIGGLEVDQKFKLTRPWNHGGEGVEEPPLKLGIW